MRYSAYVLFSEVHGRTYVGSTGDLAARVSYHNGPRARWTRRYQPWVLVYHEEYATRGEAVRREREIKALKNVLLFLERVGSRIP